VLHCCVSAMATASSSPAVTPTSPIGKRKREEESVPEKAGKDAVATSEKCNGAEHKGCTKLSKEQVEAFDRDGLLIMKAEDLWSKKELETLIEQVNVMDAWPDEAGKWMKYYETSLKYKKEAEEKKAKGEKVEEDAKEGRILQRIENFLQYNKPLDELLNGKIRNLCGDLFGEKSVLYKEKINYKLPGADGFKPHQDVAAGWWMYKQSIHISVLISIDHSTIENGCLEVVYGKHKEGMLSEQWKTLPDDVVAKLDWKYAPTAPGDIVFFDSYVPHRSGPNMTDKSRRVLYVTYAKESEGNFREKYYEDKRKSFPPDIEREAGKVYEYKV